MADPRPFKIENALEQRIVTTPAWQQGAAWGTPRPGHPEVTIEAHIAEVLENIETLYGDDSRRAALRTIALVHDTFKYRVDWERPRVGENHHAMRARRFAEAFIDDPAVLDVIELHDEAYNAWQLGDRHGDWPAARGRAVALLARLGPNVPLFLAFYRCDNATGDKSQDCLHWFESLVKQNPRC